MSFNVAANGSDIKSATGVNSLLSMNNPFTKLDTTNIVSFQTISLLFNSEPPQPPAVAPFYSNTLLKQYKHGYNYTPSVWMMWQNGSPAFPAAPASGSSATTFYPFSDDTSGYTASQTIAGTILIGGPSSILAIVAYNNAGSTLNTTDALFYITADSTNVNLYIMKRTLATINGAVIPLYLAGTTINIRLYVFVEPVAS